MIAVPLLLSLATSAGAQEANPTSSNGIGTSVERARDGGLGWIGLVGLLGLFGLIRRGNDR